MTLSNFLSLLEGAKERKPGKWQAFCPAHENRHSPSLNISEKEFGGSMFIVVYCFAGCTTDDVLKAMGLTKQDLREKPLSPELVVSERERKARSLAEFYVSLCERRSLEGITPAERINLVDAVTGEILRGGEATPARITKKT